MIDEHGRLDILVNNAGVTVDRPVWKMSLDDWHKVLRINLSGAFYMTKPALVHMLERGSGRIINISSVTGETGNIGQANYTASKAGLFGLTKTLAREAAFALRASGQARHAGWADGERRHPGADRDRHGRHDPPVHGDPLLEEIPMHRMGQPDEVARVVGFLAQDASGYITGQVWGVNGGFDM